MDPLTGRVLKRYKLPFKKMNLPPKREHMYRFKKGARRLSDWMVSGGLPPLAHGIIAQEPPRLVLSQLAPAEQARAAAQRHVLWRAVAQRASQRVFGTASGDDPDDRETQEIVRGVIEMSRDMMTDEEMNEFETALERDLDWQGGGDAPGGSSSTDPAGPDGEASDSMIPVTAERIGPPQSSASADGEPYASMTLEELLGSPSANL